MNEKYEKLLSPVKVGGVLLKNRMINSPHSIHWNSGPENYPTTEQIAFYVEKAKNGCALVNISSVNASSDPGFLRYWNIRDLATQPYLAQMVDAIHAFGSKATCFLRFNIFDMFPGMEVTGITKYGYIPPNVTECSTEQIDAYIEEYAELCFLLKQRCLFDGLFLHMSYRASSFARALSPLTNVRTDKYGGSLENRCRLPIAVADRVKERCGKDFLVEATVGADEEGSGGNTEDDLMQIVKLLDGHFDILTMKAAHIDPAHATQFQPRMPFVYLAEKAKRVVKKSLISCSGGMMDPAECERLLEEGKVDLISNARAWICDPEYGRKIIEGREDEIVPCLRCNKCHHATAFLDGARYPVCGVNQRVGWNQRLDTILDAKPSRLRKVAVIGGGPAGMEAALTCQERGHDVTLYEKTDRLGGQLNVTRSVSFKYPLQDYRKFLVHMVEKRGVRVVYNCAPTVEQLNAGGYDVILAAVGAQAYIPDIPGVDGENVVTAADVFQGLVPVGKRVVVIGGGEVGAECGLWLCEDPNRDVTVLGRKSKLAYDAPPIHYYSVFEGCWKAHANFHACPSCTATRIADGGVYYKNADGEEVFAPADTVVLAAGMRPRQDEALAYNKARGEFHTMGDCDHVADVRDALRLAYCISMGL